MSKSRKSLQLMTTFVSQKWQLAKKCMSFDTTNICIVPIFHLNNALFVHKDTLPLLMQRIMKQLSCMFFYLFCDRITHFVYFGPHFERTNLYLFNFSMSYHLHKKCHFRRRHTSVTFTEENHRKWLLLAILCMRNSQLQYENSQSKISIHWTVMATWRRLCCQTISFWSCWAIWLLKSKIQICLTNDHCIS